MVCPYSMDSPGGVQIHAIQLCERLRDRGHEVSLLAPASPDTPVPDFVVRAGRSIGIPYNGSVARLSFTPSALRAVRHWLATHDFDVVHVHEPNAPSLSLITLKLIEDTPVVATYHASAERSRALETVLPLIKPLLEKIQAGIAVSAMARKWQVEQLSSDPVLIPNGVETDFYYSATPWPNTGRPRIAFVGRFDEPRKGLDVILDGLPHIQKEVPDVELVVVGMGDADALRQKVAYLGESVTVIGRVSEEEKAQILKSSDIYVAPHLGGESFGIVLVEAMSAGTAVVASDIPAFAAVCEKGEAGRLFPVGDSQALAREVVSLLKDDDARKELADAGHSAAQRYDWSVVTQEVLRVYETVIGIPGHSQEGHTL